MIDLLEVALLAEIAGNVNPPTPPPLVPFADLLWLKLGTNSNDSSGHNNNGTTHGGAPFTTQAGVSCISLNGSTQYITLAAAPVATVSVNSSFSASAWLFIPTLIGSRMEWTPDPSYNNGDLQLSSFIDGNFLCGNASNAGVCNDIQDELQAFPTGTWVSVICLYDANNSMIGIYRDAVEVVVNGYSDCTSSGTPVSVSTWSIGCYIFGGTPGGFLQGFMAQVKMYGHVLTPIEIEQIATAGPTQ